LTATLSPDEVFQRVVASAVELFGSSAAQLWLVDEDGRHVALRGSAGAQVPLESFERVRVGEGLVGAVVATRESLAIADALDDPRARNVVPSRAAGVISVRHRAALIGERVLGALAIGCARTAPATPEEMQLLGSLASHAAHAINNAQVYREATRQARAMSALADLSRLLSETLDLDLVAQRVADSVRRLLGVRTRRASIAWTPRAMRWSRSRFLGESGRRDQPGTHVPARSRRRAARHRGGHAARHAESPRGLAVHVHTGVARGRRATRESLGARRAAAHRGARDRRPRHRRSSWAGISTTRRSGSRRRSPTRPRSRWKTRGSIRR
jgi:hypothetical protein